MTTETAFRPLRPRGAAEASRQVRFREPCGRVDGIPVAEHFCLLVAARDPECGRYVVVDTLGTGLVFEVDTSDEILDRAEAILSDLIVVNGWPQDGWLLIADVHPDITAIQPWLN